MVGRTALTLSKESPQVLIVNSYFKNVPRFVHVCVFFLSEVVVNTQLNGERLRIGRD